MNLKCLLGFHERSGCQCSKCGAGRDKDHDWFRDCEECAKCGKTRANQHTWDGCKCTSCGKIRILQIVTLSDLQAIDRDLSGSYCLAADIDALPTKDWDRGKGFAPIGNEEKRFTGVLDGNGHTIRNLFINRPSETHVGLIGYLASEQGKVHNLSLVNVNISGNKYVGGLAGINNSGTIIKCQVSGKVSGKSTVGGLVGCCMGTIEQCRAAVNVSGNDRAGGLAGANTEGTIVECHAYGKVSGKAYDIGGLAGCDYNGQFDKCYWDIQTTGQQTSSGGEGRTSKEMKSRSTFLGWNFEMVWQIEEGNSYPSLRCINRSNNKA